jgi:DMSO/TMAO reductase YedYZ heme-binding membrane subunit
VATTRSRPRGRESARPSSGGVIAEHATKVYTVAIGGIVVIVAFLALTGTGHVIDAATQHFMLFYAGVFALIALCASVALGLVATDRMFLNPGHRIFVQSAHRAASFGALAFLVIHIVTEILAQRVHVLDAFVPFLSPFRTFYIGLGTIASDLILLLVITGILRKRFTASGSAWRWRAIHYASYVAFVFGVWHGLLAGRPGKPYVDWSYGFVVAFVALGLAVRILANSLRPKENLSAPPVPDSATSGSAPMRAASMFAQLSMVRAASQTALAAESGPQPMLAAPVGDWNAQPTTGPRSAVAALPAGPGRSDGRQPFYEPGYEGPPRYLGAPRSDTGPMPRAASGPMPRAVTGPQARPTTGPQPRAATGPMPRAAAGQLPRAATGPLPRAATGPLPRAGTGPIPQATTGPLPRAATGPQPRAASGPMPRVTGPATGPRSGPMPRANTGPMPRAGGVRGGGATAPRRDTGPQRRAASGPMPRVTGPATGPGTGPIPRDTTGPMPRAGTGPRPRPGTGPQPRPGAGPMPRATGGPAPRGGTGPVPRGATGPISHAASGPMPRADSSRMPRANSGPMPRANSGPMPRADSGRMPRANSGPMPRADSGRMPRADSGPMPRADSGPMPRVGSETWPGAGAPSGRRDGAQGRGRRRAGDQPDGGRTGRRPGPRGAARGGAGRDGGPGDWNYGLPPWDGGAPEPDPNLRYREPGPGMPGYRRARDPYRGGDDSR